MGFSSHGGRAASNKVFLIKSEGQVCSLRWLSTFQRGFGADTICRALKLVIIFHITREFCLRGVMS